MSAALLIHKLKENGFRETFFYNKQERLALVKVTAFEELIGSKPAVYLTGLSAFHTQKRLDALLVKLWPDEKFITERVSIDNLGVTAQSRILQGRNIWCQL